MRAILSILLVLCFVLGGCNNQKKENVEPQKKEEKEVKQENTEKKEIVKEKEIPVKENLQKPEKTEPQDDPNVNWEEKDMQEQEWEDMRNLYIVQYLTKPASIMWGMKNPLPKGVGLYLEKGYAIYWNSSSTKRPKDLETGLLYARLKRTEDLQESLQKVANLGKGEHYYLLSYIAAWHYCLEGKNKQAKQLIEEENLSKNIPAYGIEIPEEQITMLISKSQENP